MTVRALRLLLLLICTAAACQGQSREKLMLQASELQQQGNNKGAVVVYKNLLEKYPGDIPATLSLADAYLNIGKPQQAEAELKAILDKVRENREVPVLLARIRIAEGKPADALDILKPLLGSSPAPAAALEQAGHACMILGDFKEAQSFYKETLALDSKHKKARLGLAESYFQLKQPDMAREEVELLLRTAPTDKAGLLMLAQLQTLNNEEDALIDTYGLVVKHHPTELLAAYREAFLRLSKRNDIDYAQGVANNLIRDFAKAPEGYKLKGLVHLAKNEPTLAIEPLLKALNMRQDIDTNIFLAQAYSSTGNLETAISHLQAALSRNPNLDGPRRMLASIYLRQNRLDEAIAETQKIFSKAPGDEASQRIMAEAFIAKHEYDKGLEIFTRLAEKDGQSPSVFLKKGMLLAAKGKDAAAEADLRKAVELSGNVLEPRVYLAAFLAGKNRVDEAVEVLGTGMTDGPGAALAQNAMAKLRLRQGNMDQAMELLEKAKKTDPNILTTYYNLSALFTATGKMDKAAAEFEAALAVKPDDLRALLGAAGCREALGELAQAQALLDRAVKSKDPRASLAMAEFFVRRSENAKAIIVLDEVLTSSPKEIPAWLLKSRLHAVMGEQDKVLSALGRVETINQEVGLLEKAKYYLSIKETAKSLEMAGKLRDMSPSSGNYYLPLAEIQELNGQVEAASATLNAALKVQPNNVRVLTALAKNEARQNHVEKALSLMDKAIASGMEPSNGHALKGAILQQAGDARKATGEYEKALRIQERQTLALNNLAMIYADQEGSTNKALELALRAYSLEPNNPLVLDTLGYTLIRNGRPKDALTALERADKLAPGNAEIVKHLAAARESAPSGKQ